MVKSSEVLRLAAEYALIDVYAMAPVGVSEESMKAWNKVPFELLDLVGYYAADHGEQTCMALCLAAAIAESEGD